MIWVDDFRWLGVSVSRFFQCFESVDWVTTDKNCIQPQQVRATYPQRFFCDGGNPVQVHVENPLMVSVMVMVVDTNRVNYPQLGASRITITECHILSSTATQKGKRIKRLIKIITLEPTTAVKRSRSRVTKAVSAWVFAFLWVLASSSCIIVCTCTYFPTCSSCMNALSVHINRYFASLCQYWRHMDINNTAKNAHFHRYRVCFSSFECHQVGVL